MALQFRNLTVTPADPVEEWGFEGLLAAVDRGGISDWRKIEVAVDREPWGEVAQTLGEVLACAEDLEAAEVVRAAVALARERAETAERREVAETLRSYVVRSGLNQHQFAKRIGTSASRLSTYLSGKVSPSAALVVRARRVGEPRS